MESEKLVFAAGPVTCFANPDFGTFAKSARNVMEEILYAVDPNWVADLRKPKPEKYQDKEAEKSKNGIFKSPDSPFAYYSAHRWCNFGKATRSFDKVLIVNSVSQAIKRCSHFIAYLSEVPSHGTFSEVGMAFALDKPMLLISSMDPDVSSYFAGLCTHGRGDASIAYMPIDPHASDLSRLSAEVSRFLERS
jgi:hypothetical protein